MKKFFGEFKKFITRGNILDMAVGVIVGSAFTAIVTALTKNILQPLINGLIYLIAGGDGSLEGVYTFLAGSSADLANAIYIDWGAFISAIINFLLVALVLFMIVRTINRIQQRSDLMASKIKKSMISKEDRAELKKRGIRLRDKEAVKAYFDEKKKLEEERIEAEKLALEAQAKLDREANPTTEDLLKKILAILEKNQK